MGEFRSGVNQGMGIGIGIAIGFALLFCMCAGACMIPAVILPVVEEMERQQNIEETNEKGPEPEEMEPSQGRGGSFMLKSK